MTSILALDQGTTSSRAIVFSENGQILSQGQREFTQHFPRPGWVEHDANEIWATQRAVIDQALSQVKSGIREIAAIGITNQRETTVAWDARTGEPIYRAIVWQDRRTASRCEALRQTGHATLFQLKTGLVLDAYFSGTKMQWILENIPGAREMARAGHLRFGTVDTWIVWKLTNGAEHITDPSNASRTLLFNIHTQTWDNELLALLDIPRSALPRIVPSSGVIAVADIDGVRVPISGIAGDQQAALFGQDCLQPGMAKNTYGTGCFMLMNTGSQAIASKSNLLTTIAWQKQGVTQYALEGSVFVAGALIQWLRDGLQIIDSAAQVEALAESVADTGGVIVVPAFTGLGAPHWDSDARGTILGLTRGATRAHLARASLEAIALQTAEVLKAMETDSGISLNALHVDGGAAANNLLMQMQADVLGVPVVRPQLLEATASGAAKLAAVGVGQTTFGVNASAGKVAAQMFTPKISEGERLAKLSLWKSAIARAKGALN